MKISSIVNKYGREYSPYMGRLVNHLPMLQLSLYNIYDNMDIVEKYTDYYIENFNIDRIKSNYIKINGFDECLGKRDMYEACLELVKIKSNEIGIENLTRDVLNKYMMGISSGLFHPIIRLAYAVEAFKKDENFKEEVERALAYYITSYRESKIFKNYKNYCSFQELKSIFMHPKVNEITSKEKSLGRRLKALYNSPEYMNLGFLIEGTNKDKILSILECLIPIYNRTKNIVVLHCITGLHAVIVLKEYFFDFNKALDATSTAIFTHILSIDAECKEYVKEDSIISWDYIFAKMKGTKDVHSIKLIYTSYELYKLFNLEELKIVAMNRLNTVK